MKRLSPKLVKEHDVDLKFLLRVFLASAPVGFLPGGPISSSNIFLLFFFLSFHPPARRLTPSSLCLLPATFRPSHFQIRFSQNPPSLPLSPPSPLSPLLILTLPRSLQERSEAFPLPNSPRALPALPGGVLIGEMKGETHSQEGPEWEVRSGDRAWTPQEQQS